MVWVRAEGVAGGWLLSGDEPSLGGEGQESLTGQEPGLGGARQIKLDPFILNALLDDQADEWRRAIDRVLDQGQGRAYALALTRIVAAGSRRRRGVGPRTGYSTAQRIAATRALEAFGEAVAVQALVDLLGDREWWLGQYAIDALVAIGPAASQTVMEALDDSDPIVRRRAALILGGIGDWRALERLHKRLDEDPVGWVRECAARALGRMGARQSIAVLEAAYREDPDVGVRRAAWEALNCLGYGKE